MGPAGGMGMMLRPGMDLDGCHDSMGPRHDRTCHDELSEQRLDTLETQMEMANDATHDAWPLSGDSRLSVWCTPYTFVNP